VLTWLIGSGVGPALVGVPVSWAADALADAARRWFRRFRRSDDLSHLVRAATGTSTDLSRAEFDAVRRLLESQQTWDLAGRGTVEDLAASIAACLPARDGRSAEDSLGAARSIARGLLEFAVADLDPKIFQQVLLTRLQRMEAGLASALDEILVGLHADLAARLDATGELDAERFAEAMEYLKRLLDRLPAGIADRNEIAVYLRTLIDWLNRDPWPRDRRFGGPVLTPAAIERKLRVITMNRAGRQEADADGLMTRCRRLVVLGGPGSGKSWLAKRAVRHCAENALNALAAGEPLDEVDLPLYTTCSRLFGAGGDIREAAVSSALDQLGDLGGSRLSAAVRMLFTERNTSAVLLVIDSLDEAHGPDDRLRQADTLPWRIVLTTRASSWNMQLHIEERNDSHRIAELQALHYPDDVEPFIQQWFRERPAWGTDLAVQIAHRPSLQKAATVPLILAFYCIVGGGQPLPEFTRDLYAKVLRRVLTSRWRGSGDASPDIDACLRTLRAWAWSAASSDPVSGIGTWSDDILTEDGQFGEADEAAAGNVAMALGPPDVDTGQTPRRFVHRSIREHLVAEHIATLSAGEAADALLPHLWHDPDWEYSAPEALAMHPRHDQVARDLICRAAGSDEIPADLSVIDAGWALRELLARVAAESGEAGWTPEVAQMIGQARVELARSARANDLGVEASWETSNRHAREELLKLLAVPSDRWDRPRRLVGGIVQLAPAPEEKRAARAALLGLLSGQTHARVAAELARGVARLDPTAEEKRAAREVLLGLQASQTDGYLATELAVAVAQLEPAAQTKRRAREILLGFLVGQHNGHMALELVRGVVQLAPTTAEKREAREALLGLLARSINGYVAKRIVEGIIQLVPAAEDERSAREALVGLLASPVKAIAAAEAARGIVQLHPTADDERRTREVLIRLLHGPIEADVAAYIKMTLQLYPTADDERRIRQDVPQGRPSLAGASTREDPAAEIKAQEREMLLAWLASPHDRHSTQRHSERLVQLAATPQDKHHARGELLRLLADQANPTISAVLADAVAQLGPPEEDKRQARKALLRLLARSASGWEAAELARAVAQLSPGAEEKLQARAALLQLMVSPDLSSPESLAGAVAQLDPTAKDTQRARALLLQHLARRYSAWSAPRAAQAVFQLDPTENEQRQARDVLFGHLASVTNHWTAVDLMSEASQFDPTLRDLSTWRNWTTPPTAELLAAVRRNSTLASWLAALPWLPAITADPENRT
jgi:hypothetical protein